MALGDPVDGVGTAAGGTLVMSSPSALRPCLAVCGSALTFALLIERAGFPATVMLMVLIASVGSRDVSGPQSLLLAIVVAVTMTILFIGLLDQPFTVFPRV